MVGGKRIFRGKQNLKGMQRMSRKVGSFLFDPFCPPSLSFLPLPPRRPKRSSRSHCGLERVRKFASLVNFPFVVWLGETHVIPLVDSNCSDRDQALDIVTHKKLFLLSFVCCFASRSASV